MGKSSTADEVTGLLKTTQTVKDLCSGLIKNQNPPPTGYHIYTDHYYTSPELADELFRDALVTTSTIMANRKNMPQNLKASHTKKMKKGEIISYWKNEKLALAWKDKRVVTMLSTFHKGDKNDVTSIPSKYPNQPPVSKSNVILDYTRKMGGVDRTDHYIASYQFIRRTKKWYQKMFFWLLKVCILNSYILFTQ